MSATPALQQPLYNVELVKASNPKGEPFYAYLLLPEALLEIFRKKLKADEDLKLEKYGVILASGKGHAPSPEHIEYINQRFGS